MKKRSVPIKLLFIVALLFVLFSNCVKQRQSDLGISKLFTGKLPEGISITYPQNKTLFPPEFAAPTFLWEDTNQKSDAWYIFVNFTNGNKPLIAFSEKKQWKPDNEQWKNIKENSLKKQISISIAGIQKTKPNKFLSGSSVSIETSTDSVGASIFFRDVILPFDSARKHVDSIRYCLGDVSSENRSRVLMSGLSVCGNCHSFSSDGQTMGMDIDYANDKGSYIISSIEKYTALKAEKIITWGDYKKEDKQTTFGLLSQISPDGKYVVSTVKDRSIFVPINTNFSYSQLFFPIKGILVIYDRSTKKFLPLPGADDPKYVQSNPAWSPDGKYIYFAHSEAYNSKLAEMSKSAVMETEVAEEFISGKRDFKFDIYRIPFNNGKGGEAIPVKGASHNGMSNYFPKISPDGKWMIFTQAKNFMLLQPDSKLYIIAAEGGVPRLMTCNSSQMNSWHSWSPNSKWVAFSSKMRGPYSKIYLTHVDDKGDDTPPVCLENFAPDKRAANIPEFVNRKFDSWFSLTDAFSDSGNYQFRIAKNMLHYGDLFGAESTLTIAASIEPGNYGIFLEKGILLAKKGDKEGAFQNFSKAIELSPDNANVHYNMGAFKNGIGDYAGAIVHFNKAIGFEPKHGQAYFFRGVAKFQTEDFTGALKDFDQAIAQDPSNALVLDMRAIIKRQLGDLKGALSDLDKAIALDWRNPKPYLHRSYVKQDMNDSIGALNDFQMYKRFQSGE